MSSKVDNVVIRIQGLFPIIETVSKLNGPDMQFAGKMLLTELSNLENDLDKCDITKENDRRTVELTRMGIKEIKKRINYNMNYDWKGIILLTIFVTVSFGMGCFSGYLMSYS